MKDKFRENIKIAPRRRAGDPALSGAGLHRWRPAPTAEADLLQGRPYLLILVLALWHERLHGTGARHPGGRVGLLGSYSLGQFSKDIYRALPACRRSSCSPCSSAVWCPDGTLGARMDK